MITRKEFADRMLTKLGAPTSANNRRALVAWMHTEGYGGKNNPLNTSLKMPGSTTFNSHGVQNYLEITDGVSAAARTLLEGEEEWNYEPIITLLQQNRKPERTLAALLKSSWGTTDLVLRVLDDVRADFDKYASADAARE